MSQPCLCVFLKIKARFSCLWYLNCFGSSYRGLRKWALVVLSMHYYSVLFSSDHACVHERTKAIKSHLIERLMHGKNYWGLYFVLNKSTQIFFGFTFQFHLKIAISITEMPGGGGGSLLSHQFHERKIMNLNNFSPIRLWHFYYSRRVMPSVFWFLNVIQRTTKPTVWTFCVVPHQSAHKSWICLRLGTC